MKKVSGFGAWLKAAREQAGVSQGTLAEALGVKQPVVSRIENGLSSKITRDDASIIAELLRVPLSEVELAAGFASRKAALPAVECLTPEDAALLSKWHELSPESQALVSALVEQLAARHR